MGSLHRVELKPGNFRHQRAKFRNPIDPISGRSRKGPILWING
jgi:hypothetical protein